MFKNPFLPVALGVQAVRIGLEAQTVIALRLAGMAGLWSAPPGEARRMVAEKAQAVIEASEAATRAAIAGQGPVRAFQAGMDEIGRHTSANVERLVRHGAPKAARGR